MADLRDIFNKKKEALTQGDKLDVNGICEECFWPIDHGFYDSKNKKLKMVCSNGHETTIDWDMGNG